MKERQQCTYIRDKFSRNITLAFKAKLEEERIRGQVLKPIIGASHRSAPLLVEFWLDRDDSVPVCVAEWTRGRFVESRSRGSPSLRLPAMRQVLLTYQGAWGEITSLKISPDTYVEAVMRQLVDHNEPVALWEVVLAEIPCLRERAGCEDFAACMESVRALGPARGRFGRTYMFV